MLYYQDKKVQRSILNGYFVTIKAKEYGLCQKAGFYPSKRRIAKIKQELTDIGEMRPGSLTRQYKNPKDQTGGFYQLSYTHKMKSKTEYVRSHNIDALKKQINAYKKFKNLIEKWVELSIEHSKLKMDSSNQGRQK